MPTALGGGGCEPFSQQFQTANDWMHSNSLQYEPYDGSIIISLRHHDVVLKVNFANGSGDGHIIWELGNPDEHGGIIGGPGGAPLPTFTLTTNGAGGPDLGYPWFSHQHDAGFAMRGKLVNGSRIVYDLGRWQHTPSVLQSERRQPLPIAVNRRAELDRQFEHQWRFVGLLLRPRQLTTVAERRHLLRVPESTWDRTQQMTETVEIDKNSNFVFGMNVTVDNYRSLRMQDLYTAINP